MYRGIFLQEHLVFLRVWTAQQISDIQVLSLPWVNSATVRLCLGLLVLKIRIMQVVPQMVTTRMKRGYTCGLLRKNYFETHGVWSGLVVRSMKNKPSGRIHIIHFGFLWQLTCGCRVVWPAVTPLPCSHLLLSCPPMLVWTFAALVALDGKGFVPRGSL